MISLLILLMLPVQSDEDGPRTHSEMRAALVYGARPQASTGGWIRAGERSVPAAFALSAVVPGLGQAYNRQWVKAGVAVAIEAAVITGYSIARSRGLDGEAAFQAFAHADWSPVRYASWLNDYRDYLVSEFGHEVTAPAVQAPAGIDFSHPEQWTGSEEAAVADFVQQIRAIERQVYHPETGATFSHVLPGFGEQQYYELIGKYFQFAPGWDDYPVWVDADGNYTVAIDPERTGEGGSKPNVSDTFYDYAKDHADAEDLLRTASRVSILFVVNHLFAAIDAAVSAKLHNDRLSSQLGLAYGPGGTPQPVAVLRLRL